MTGPATTSTNSPAIPAQSFAKFLVAGLVVLNLVVMAIGWFSLKRSRAQYDERAVVTAQNISKILDENLSGIVAKVDIAMQAVVDEAQRQLSSGGIQEPALNAFIVREHARISELVAFRATDASGDAIYGPKARAVNTSSLAHRDYFKHLKETPGAGLVISKPLIGGISGKWMVVLARRINQPDGAFAGLVYTGVALEYLTKGFSRIDIGKHGSISLIDRDNAIVARYPDDQATGSFVGQTIPSGPLSELIRSNRMEGVYAKKSGVDGIERTFSFRRLGVLQPYYLLVGLASIDHLADWRTEVWVLCSFMGIFFVLTLASALVIYREWQRNGREVSGRKLAQEMLLLQKEELEATLARTKRLEGLISICMHCKKINNKQDSWEQVEKYISDNSDALFSHGICPDCVKAHYPRLNRP